MRILALDIGERRVGMALSDPDERVATPLGIADSESLRADPSRLADIVAEHDVGFLVVGLPRSLDGSEGPQAERVRMWTDQVCGASGVPFAFTDERMTSAEARRAMREAGLSERRQRGRLDAAAAALMLQAYLDRRADGSNGSAG